MAEELDQAKRRRFLTLVDDFGRRWDTTEDVTPGAGPCAPINPKGWTDPLATPQQILVRALQTDPDTGRLVLALKDGYVLWRDNLKQKAQEYQQRLYNDAMMLFGTEGVKAYEERSPGLLNYTGPGPQAWEPIEAAIQGNSAALGKKPLSSDPRIAKFFVKAEPVALNFSDESLDEYGDVEEAVDPEATGGKKVPVKPGKQKAPPKQLVEA